MQVELKIKEILEVSGSVESKVREIQKLMNWDRKKLIGAITKHGISGSKQRDAVINEFWGRDALKNERR